MSRKSRRSRARLVQEQASVAYWKNRTKQVAEEAFSLQCKIGRLDKELFEANQEIQKMSRPDVIVARKFKYNAPHGEELAFQVIIDRRFARWEFGERSSRNMTSARHYVEGLFFEIRAKMVEGMENVLLGREVRESVL